MTYNPNTRLLLKFDEASGTTTVTDTSVFRNTATFSAGAVTSTQGVFGTNSAPIGNPGGTFAASSVVVNAPGAVFSPGVTPRQFDFWYRRWGYPVTRDPQPLMYIKFTNGNTLSFRVGTSTLVGSYSGPINAYQSSSYISPVNTWVHYRLLIDGPTLRIGAGGVEIGSITVAGDIWTGTVANPPIEISFGTAFSGLYAGQGYIDAIEFTEGTVTWGGGAYTIPTNEPDDGEVLPEITGAGTNTLENVTSVADGSHFAILNAAGANVLDGVVSLGDARHFDQDAIGANVLDAVTCEGIGQIGEGGLVVGTATLDNVSSYGAVWQSIVRLLDGANLADDVVSAGEAYLGWAVALGSSAVDDVTQMSSGTVAASAGSGGGESVTSVTSQGCGALSISAAGLSSVSLMSAGNAECVTILSGANTIGCASSGAGGVVVSGTGDNTLQGLVSVGQVVRTTFVEGASVLSVTSSGHGVLPIFGTGSNSISVETLQPFYGGDPDYAVVRTLTDALFVKHAPQSIRVYS